MATREIIDFIINLGGNATAGANALAGAVDRLGQSAKKTAGALANDLNKSARALNQNQLISQFETLSSLLIQVGGNTSQLGIFMSSAARPVALLTSVLGGASLALLAIPAAGLGAVAAIRAVTEAGESAVETLTKMGRIDLITTDQIHALKDYRSAADDLTASLEGLKAQAGAAAAPGAARTASATSLLLQGDRQAWGAVGQMFTSPFGAVSGLQELKKIADSRTAEAVAEEQARRDWLRETEIAMRQAEDEEKIRKANKTAAPAAVNKAVSDRESAAKAADRAKAQAEEDAIRAALAMDEQLKQRHAEYIKGEEALLDLRNRAMQDLIDTTGKWQDQVRSIRTDMVLQTRGFESGLVAQGMGSLTGGLGEVAGFLGSGLSAGGVMDPVTTAVVMGISMVGDIQETLEGLLTQVKDLYMDLPKIISDLVQEFVPELIRAAPEIASAFLILGPSIALELVKVAPELFDELVKAVLDAPRVFAHAILALPEAFAEAISKAIEKGINPIDGSGSVEGRERRASFIGAAVGGLLGGPVGGAVGAAGGLAIDRLAHGKTLGGKPRSGKASTARTRGGPSIGTMIVVAPNPREHMRQMRHLQGSYGYGFDLDPVVA